MRDTLCAIFETVVGESANALCQAHHGPEFSEEILSSYFGVILNTV
jgi:hypothetical protein